MSTQPSDGMPERVALGVILVCIAMMAILLLLVPE